MATFKIRSVSLLAWFVVALFMFVGLGTAFAGDLDEAIGAYARKDYKEAVRLYLPLAIQGNAIAQYTLGVMYNNGQGVTQDEAEAARWYRKASDQGSVSAQFIVGIMYAEGHGVTQDYVEGHKWLNLAATQGHKNATKYRDKVAKLMTTSQIAEAQQLAREWRPKASTSTTFLPRKPQKPAKKLKSKAAPTTSIRERNALIQSQLTSLGYTPGPADGIVGPKTRAAISAFQSREGLTVTGKVSDKLEAALRTAPR